MHVQSVGKAVEELGLAYAAEMDDGATTAGTVQQLPGQLGPSLAIPPSTAPALTHMDQVYVPQGLADEGSQGVPCKYPKTGNSNVHPQVNGQSGPSVHGVLFSNA